MRFNIIALQLNRLTVRSRGFAVSAGHVESVAEVVLRIGRIGFRGYRFLEVLDGGFVEFKRVLCGAKIVQSIVIVRIEADGGAKCRERFLVTSGFIKTRAEIVERNNVIRFQPDGVI